MEKGLIVTYLAKNFRNSTFILNDNIRFGYFYDKICSRSSQPTTYNYLCI